MKRFDNHIHLRTLEICPERLISQLESAGMWGANVLSLSPKGYSISQDTPEYEVRFALAHCAWPWHDECIALYGKFLNALTKRDDITAEMFIDITPGTPPMYRKELLNKLHCIGYDIQNNLLFGTDCRADNYNIDWSIQWQQRDDALYDELAIDEQTRALIYGENLMRFLGISKNTVQHKAQTADGRIEKH